MASAARRRAKPSLATRIKTYWLVALVPIVAIGFALYQLERWPGFRVSHIDVSGESVVSRSEILARAAVDPKVNVWTLDVRKIAQRIEAIPYIDQAIVHRTFPAKLDIAVTERVPDGCVRADDAEYVTVDAARRILERGCRAGLPTYDPGGVDPLEPGTFLASPALAALQSDVRSLSAGTYATLRHDAFGGLTAIRRDGVAVLFGTERDLADKERIADAVLAKFGPRRLRSIDVRAPEAPVVVQR